MSTAVRPGYKLTEVGVIPEDWEIVTLGQLGCWHSGGTPRMSNSDYWNGTIPWVSAKDMKSPALHDSQMHVTKSAIGNGTRLAPADAILLVVRGMILAHTLPVALTKRPMAFNQDLRSLTPSQSVQSDFCLFWFQANKGNVLCTATESTHGTKRLPTDDLFSIKLALPSLTEQRAIAKSLSDVDSLLGSLYRLLTKKRDLKQAAMQELLTGKRRLPGFSGEWKRRRLGELGTFLKGSGIRKDDAQSGDLPCVRYGELYTHHHDWIKRHYSWVSREVASAAQRLRKGDVLFAGSGETKGEIGKCASFLADCEAYAGGDIVILRPQGVDSLFLGYLCNTPAIATQKASMGQGDAVVHISALSLATIQVTIPPIAEQSAIASVLSDIDSDIAALERHRDKTKLLKQAMMQELLTGRTRLI